MRRYYRPAGQNSSPFPLIKSEHGVRPPVVAWIFYLENRMALGETVEKFFSNRSSKPEKAIALMVPHGRYQSCGGVQGAVYSRIKWPATAVVISPSHTGMGKPVSIVHKGMWETPLGQIAIHQKLAERIRKSDLNLIQFDEKAHEEEHAIEVQVPFLQKSQSIRSFVPVIVRECDETSSKTIGEAIAQAIRQNGEEVLLIGTTNLTRYEPREIVMEKDKKLLDAILQLDEMKLWDAVKKMESSMCGAGATAVLMAAAKHLGTSRAVLVKYKVSGEETQDKLSVVGYAGVIIQ